MVNILEIVNERKLYEGTTKSLTQLNVQFLAKKKRIPTKQIGQFRYFNYPFTTV